MLHITAWTVRCLSHARGFPRLARESILSLDQRLWSVYQSWCLSQGISSTRTSVSNLSSSAIKDITLRSLQFCDMVNLNTAHDLDFLKEVFQLLSWKPQKSFYGVGWNLDVVCTFLSLPQFEPLDKAPLKKLILKKIFLLALPNAKCIREL